MLFRSSLLTFVALAARCWENGRLDDHLGFASSLIRGSHQLIDDNASLVEISFLFFIEFAANWVK